MTFLHDLQWVLPLRSPLLTEVAIGLSWLGYTTFIMFFMALGYWTWSKSIFYRLFILVAVNATLNAFVKDWFQDPRPPLALRLDDLVGASYGLPSGHAQLAVVMWLWLAWEVRRTWAWVVGSAIALGVMVSRMYLGVHDFEDVLVGAALGAVSLLLFERIRHQQWLWQRSVKVSIAVIATVTVCTLLSWPGTAPEYIPTLAGWLIAASWCLDFDKRHMGFTPPSALWRRVLLGVVGALCFMGEQKLLKLAGTQLSLDPALWALIKGLVNGAFVSLVIPWGALRLGLANRTTPTQAPKPTAT